MIVKKLIALVLLVGLLTMAVGCPGTTPDTKKTGGASPPTGGSPAPTGKTGSCPVVTR